MAKYSALKEQVRDIIEERKPKLDAVRSDKAGICPTCRNNDSCIFLQKATEPIYQCEEFETSRPEPQKRTSAEIPNTQVSMSEPSQLKGLCGNCSKNKTCSFNKPESGIWHCEEYE